KRVRAVEPLSGLICTVDIRPRAGGDDSFAPNSDRPVLDDAMPRIHRDDVACATDPVDGRGREVCNEQKEARESENRRDSETDTSDGVIRFCLAGSSGAVP